MMCIIKIMAQWHTSFIFTEISNIWKCSIWSKTGLTSELRALHGAWPTPRSSSMEENTDLSSARSIWGGLVPRIFTPFRCRGMARLLGICPPTDTIQPVQPYGEKESLCSLSLAWNTTDYQDQFWATLQFIMVKIRNAWSACKGTIK